MWWLIIIAVHINDPSDIPGRVELSFHDQQSCESAMSTIKYYLKFKSFKVEAKCEKRSLS
jgi:hypothetical protein